MPRPILKLEIELIPKTCYGQNVRTMISAKRWDKFRKEVYANDNNRCRICESEKRLNCHEVWEYNDAARTQRLLRFETVCGMCHHVVHFGMSRILAKKGQLDIEAVVQHFLKVNGVDLLTFKSHLQQAIQTWDERSRHQWTADYGEWSWLISG